MNIRNYNIFFHTHTISGIIICGLLYVIFFAGSFSFFKKEISAWQKNTSYTTYEKDQHSYDYLLDSLKGGMNMHGRDISIYMQRTGVGAYFNLSASNDSILNKENVAHLAAKKKSEGGQPTKGRRGRGGEDSKYFNYDFVKKSSGDYATNYDMGEFLYRLHFLAQLNEVPIRMGIAPFGYFVAGVTSFLFLFALITGLLLHWDKIVNNFFVYRPFNKWKTVWTDLHTGLGVIGFPFQFLYAVTGIFLIINSVLVLPFSNLLYKGDTDKMYQDLGYSRNVTHAYSYQPMEHNVRIADYLSLAEQKYPDADVTRFFIKNYADSNMHIIMELEAKHPKSFAGVGMVDIRVHDQKIMHEKSPTQNLTYVDWIKALIYRLHFGDFGGLPLRALYFVLGIMGCLVITSGILIWLVARDKNNVLPYKRKFNAWLANFFMAVCLTMLPVTALTFIAIKVSPVVDQSFIYRVYFTCWLLFTLYYTLRKSINRTNRESLLLGSVLAFLVPLTNGIVTGNWFWKTLFYRQTDLFLIDFLWIIIAVIALTAFMKSRQFFKNLAQQKK